MMLPTISDTAINLLNQVSIQIQDELALRGEHYAIEALNEVLSLWLELSIEQLCEDALYHCVTGDRSYSFNRSGFERFLKQANDQTMTASVKEPLVLVEGY